MNHIHKIHEELFNILIFITVIWIIFLLEQVFPLERLGLIPRDQGGLIGILTMTFLHANFQHLLSNTIPLAVLLALLAGSQADTKKIVGLITLIGGLLLWVFGRQHSIHIGASLLIFGLATFLVVAGLLEKRIIPLIISIIVVFMYGSTLLGGILPSQSGVSWEGHLMGGIAGIVTAWALINNR